MRNMKPSTKKKFAWEEREKVLRIIFAKLNSGEIPIYWREIDVTELKKEILGDDPNMDFMIEEEEQIAEAETEAQKYTKDYYESEKDKSETADKFYKTEHGNSGVKYKSKQMDPMERPEQFKDTKSEEMKSDFSVSEYNSENKAKGEQENECDKNFDADTGNRDDGS